MKIAWALNPFDENRKLQAKAVTLLKFLSPLSDEPEIIYVSSPAEVELALAFEIPKPKRFSDYPEMLLRKLVKKLGLKEAKITVLAQKDFSLTSSAQRLTKYLSRKNIKLILVATHARSGLPRFFMGSFAETFVHYSKSNMILFNENTSVRQKPKNLLFAHDLTPEADRALVQAIKYAHTWGAKLHVIHISNLSYNVRTNEAELADYQIQQVVKKIEKKLKTAKIDGSVVISEEHIHPTHELILMRMKSIRAEMIIVVAKTGRFMSLLGGSVTRKLIRSSPVPVLVIKS